MQEVIKSKHLLEAFKKAGKRTHLVGDQSSGVLIALDVEGRLFTILKGEIMTRVNLDAVLGKNTRSQYLNPGGDGLWPAPEGTLLGYQYSTGTWRVPPGLRSARYLVVESTEVSASVIAEVDLVNNQGIGIPAIFSRKIRIEPDDLAITVNTEESITYIGSRPLSISECLLAPWTLCQFDCGPGCEVVFPSASESSVWDLYDLGKKTEIIKEEGFSRTLTDGSSRYQIAMDKDVQWIEFHDPRRGLIVTRKAELLMDGQSYIDIRDASPDISPDTRGVRYSVYSDTSGFMEIEAAGGCPGEILPGAEMKVSVSTRFIIK